MADIAELGFSIPTAPIDNAAKSMDAMGKSAEGATKATEKMNRGTEAMMKQIASLERALGLSVTATGKLTEEISKIGTTSEKSKKETEGFSVSIQRLIDKADPLAAAQKKNATQTEALNKALRDGRVSADLHAKATAILEKEMADAVSEIEKSSQATGKLSEEAKKASGNIDSMGKSGSQLTAVMGKIAGVITAALSVRQIQQYADTWSDLSARIQVSIGATGDSAEVMKRLGDISRITYTSLEATAESFANNAFTLKALGKSTVEQLNYTEALNNALVISGAKGNDFMLVQNALGRSMAEGAVKGDDLNLVLNYGSRVAESLAAELGVNVTQLRSLAKDGKITGDVIYSALTNRMEELRKEAESMPATITDAFVLIRNAVLESVGVYDQQNGLSEALAENLVKVADAIRNTDWSPYINGLTTAAKLYAAYLIAVKAYPAAAAAWVVAIRVKTAALAAFSMQAAMTRKTLLTMNTALSVVGAAFAGWQIGTYLREEFEIVEKAGIALMSGLHQAAIAVGGVFKGLGETMKFALTSPLSFVWGRIVSFLEMIQGLGASAAKALGFEGLAEVIGKDLTHLRTTTDQEYRATIQGIVDTTKSEMAGVSDVYFELFDSVGKKAKEAGSVIEESAKNTGGTVTNTITEEMSKADKAYAKFRANLELTIQSTNLMSAAYLTSAEAVEEVLIQQEIESEVLKQGAKHREEITRLIREQHAANKALDLSKTIADMRAQNAELKAYEAVLIAGGDATEAGRQALEAYNDQREIEATLVGKTSKEIDKLLPKLREEQKIRRDQRARNKDIEELNGLVKDTRTAQEKANAELERLENLAKNAKTPEHLEAIRRKVAEVKSSMSEWGQFTQRAIDSVDDAFADMWRNIGGGFDSFADGLKNAFKNLLAELAHMAITRPIIMQFASMLGIGGGTQGNNGIWGGLLGGGSGGGGGGMNWGSLLSTGQSLYSALTGWGPAMLAGWQSGGLSGAISGVGGHFGGLLGSAASTVGGWLGGSAAAGSAAGGVGYGLGSSLVSGQIGSAAYAGASAGAASGAGGILSNLSGFATNPIGWITAGVMASWKLHEAGIKPDQQAQRDAWGRNTSGGAGILKEITSFTAGVGEKLDQVFNGLLTGIGLSDKFAGRLVSVLTGGPINQMFGLGMARLFGSGEKYKRTVGSAQGSYSAGEYTGMGAVESWFDGARKFGEDFDQSLHGLNEAFASSLGGLFEMFDIDSDIMTTAQARLRRTSGKLLAGFTASFDDAVISMSGQYSRKGNIQAGLEQFFDDVMGRGLSEAIAASQLPEYLKELTDGLTTAAEVSEAVGGLFARFEGVNNTIEALNFSAFELTDAGLRGADALLDLSAAIAGLEDPTTADKIASLTALTSTYYDQFFTDAEKTENTINSITRAFEEAAVELAASREAYRAMVEDIDLTTEAGREMFATMMALSGQAAQYFSIVEQQAALAEQQTASGYVAAVNAAQGAFNRLQQSINAEIQAAQSGINELSRLAGSLESALKSMRLDSDEFDRMRRKQAQAQLSAALAIGRAGGSLRGVDLSDALTELGRANTDLFGSFEDYARDYWKTAHDINELAGLTGDQLSVEEQAVERLDGILEAAQRQMDILLGIDTSILSVAHALANFQKATSVASATPKTAEQAVRSAYVEVLGRTGEDAGVAGWVAAIQKGETTLAKLKQDLARGALDFDSSGYTGVVSQADIELSKKNAAKYLGIPGFASGGFHSGGLRLVGEYGPELEVTGPSRIYNAGQTAAMLSGGGDVAEAITRLQQAVERQGDALRSIAKHAMQTARRVEFLERWDYDGLPPEREVA